MNLIKKILKKPQWLTLDIASSPNTAESRFFILDRSCYREVVRNYKVSAFDLVRLVRNELTVLKAEGGKVLWYVRRVGPGHYNVCYAIVHPSISSMGSGLYSLIPEGWLLYSMLAPEQIYQIQSVRNYWGYLSQQGTLHTTLVSGLMADSQLFANALGVMPQSNPQILDLQQQSRGELFVLPLSLLPGAIVANQSQHSLGPVDYRLWGKRIGLSLAGYSLLVSVALLGFKYYLNSEVDSLKVSAEAVFSQQQQLNQQQQQIDDYAKLLQNSTDSTAVFTAIAETIGDSGQLERIQLSADRIQISGFATSATLVLSKFAENAKFKEVKFDRNIQRVREKEAFSIIMTYQAKSGISAQSGANDEAH